MKSLMIKDLALDKELDGKTMAAVRGGFNNGNIFKGGSAWTMPSSDYCPPSYDPSSYPSSPSTVNTATQSNSIVQGGNVQAGNGSLTSGGIAITNAPFALGLNLNGSTIG